ncbi:MAG: hypothetical protein RMK19_01880 [Bacteroidia bacterium]|nr:hypothetical protein [Bacteroidia bacterium]MDW8014743.1 hypothetical protein [Bacteroidia bacterium]
MRRFIIGVGLLLILGAGSLWMYQRFIHPPRMPALWQNVPKNYSLVAYTPSFSQSWRVLRHSRLNETWLRSPSFQSAYELGRVWDSLLHSSEQIERWLLGHALLIAVYPEGTLYLIEAPFLSKIGDWRGEMQQLARQYKWHIESTQTKGGYMLWKLHQGYLVPAGSILVYSTQPLLIQRFLSGEDLSPLPFQRESFFGEDKVWLTLLTTGKALSSLFSHPLLEFLKGWDTLQLRIQLFEEEVRIEGQCRWIDPVWGALARGPASLADLCPPSTTALVSWRFLNPLAYFFAHLKEAPLPEGSLSFSSTETFFSSLAGEIGIVHDREAPYLICRLKSDSPFSLFPRLQSIEHRGYEVRQVRSEGLLRWAFGKGFSGWERPWVLQVGEWLLIARSPTPLQRWIDAFIARKSLYSRKDFLDPTSERTLVGGYLDCRHSSWLRTWLPDQSAEQWQEELKPYEAAYFTVEPTDSLHLRITVRLLWREDSLPSSAQSDTLKPIRLPFSSETDTLLQDGPQEEYYPNGVVKRRYILMDGNLEGEYTEYHPNGLVKVQGFYEQGQKVGKWRYYNSKGELLREEVWSSESTDSASGP